MATSLDRGLCGLPRSSIRFDRIRGSATVRLGTGHVYERYVKPSLSQVMAAGSGAEHPGCLSAIPRRSATSKDEDLMNETLSDLQFHVDRMGATLYIGHENTPWHRGNLCHEQSAKGGDDPG
jgi:hypothetical protein